MAFTIGETITLTWSVTNTGTSSGYYQAYATYGDILFQYSVLIDSLATHTFSQDITITETVSRFTSTCGEVIDITAT